MTTTERKLIGSIHTGGGSCDFSSIFDGEHTSIDQIGIDLPGRVEAREEAMRGLPDIAREVMPDGDQRDMTVAIRNHNGIKIFSAKLSLEAEWLD